MSNQTHDKRSALMGISRWAYWRCRFLVSSWWLARRSVVLGFTHWVNGL